MRFERTSLNPLCLRACVSRYDNSSFTVCRFPVQLMANISIVVWCDVVRVPDETCYHNNLLLENVEHCEGEPEQADTGLCH